MSGIHGCVCAMSAGIVFIPATLSRLPPSWIDRTPYTAYALSRVCVLCPLSLLKYAPRFPYNDCNDASILPKLVKLPDCLQALARNFWGAATPAPGPYGATLRTLLHGGSTGAGWLVL